MSGSQNGALTEGEVSATINSMLRKWLIEELEGNLELHKKILRLQKGRFIRDVIAWLLGIWGGISIGYW